MAISIIFVSDKLLCFMRRFRLFVPALAVLLCVAFLAVGQNPTKFTLKGNIDFVLKQFDQGAVIESVALRVYPNMTVIKNGGGEISHYGVFNGVPQMAELVVDLTIPGGSGSARVPFVLEEGVLVFDGSITPSGGKLNNSLRDLWVSFRDMKDANILDAIRKYVAKEENAPASVILLSVVARSSLNPEELLSIIEDSPQQVKGHRDVKALIGELEVEAMRVQNQKSTEKGQMFKDFSVFYDGKMQSLSDYVGKGKYVLVDFWASWCGPCRAEIPNVVNVYKKYAGENFEVVGVAINDKPENSLKAIEQLGVTYPQILGAGPEIAAIYGINSIPHVILFAPDGKVLTRGHIQGEQLEEIVKKALKK